MLVSLIVGCGLLADGWLCVQAVTECIDTYCITATGEIVVQVEVEACWLWSWDCCLLTWQGDKVKWHFLKRECVQGGEGGWGENRFPIRLISKQFQMLPHTPHPDLKYILGSVSFLFSCYAPDFHQALDLCSCVMGYLRISDDHFDKESAKLHRNIASVNLALITSMFSYCCLFCIRLRCSWSLLDFVPQESQ